MTIFPDEVRSVEWNRDTDELYVIIYNHISISFCRRKDAPDFIQAYLVHNQPNVINHSLNKWTYFFYERGSDLHVDLPVKLGKWIPIDVNWISETRNFKCTSCECISVDYYFTKKCGFNFCPQCGADMRGDKNE